MAARRLLILANGHGEDAIAGRICDRLFARGLGPGHLEAWPIVGRGEAFRARGVTCVGVPNHLPSEGFATLGAGRFVRDLRAGWLQVHAAQMRAAAAMRGTYTAALAIGDVVPLGLARLADLPTICVACAKSVRHARRHRFRILETRLMRGTRVVFARDADSAAWMAARGIPARHAGNPMMDGLEPEGELSTLNGRDTVIAALPGSRTAQGRNLLSIAAVADALARRLASPSRTVVLCAATGSVDLEPLARHIADHGGHVWRMLSASTARTPADGEGASTPVLAAEHVSGLRLEVWTDRFAAIVRRATVVVGLAGTANEQAAGLGKPLVMYPDAGVFDAAYVRMKRHYLGGAARAVEADPTAVAAALQDLLANERARHEMAAAGRALMGGPGASDEIAAAVIALLGEKEPTNR